MKCACHADRVAVMIFGWMTSAGPEEAPLCQDCVGDWMRRFAHSPAGSTVRCKAVPSE